MSSMTKKDYELIAGAIRDAYKAGYGSDPTKSTGDTWVNYKQLIDKFANRLKKDNPKFDRQKFLEACGIKQEITDRVRCNNCYTVYPEETIKCSKCKTDEYFMQPFIPSEADKAV